MIKWEELKNLEQLPKDGTRFLACKDGMAYAINEDGYSYSYPSLFRIDVLIYIWDLPLEEDNFMNFATSEIISPKQMFSLYTHFVIINRPERLNPETSHKDDMIV